MNLKSNKMFIIYFCFLLEKEMATHSSNLAWKIPWAEKPGRLQSMGPQRTGHNWVLTHSGISSYKEWILCALFIIAMFVQFYKHWKHWWIDARSYARRLPWWLSGKESACQCRRPGFNPWVRKIPWRRKWQPNPVFLPGKFQDKGALWGYSPWGHKSQIWRVTKQQATATTEVSTGWSFKLALVFTPLLSAFLGSPSKRLSISPHPSPWFSDSQRIMSTGLETGLEKIFIFCK